MAVPALLFVDSETSGLLDRAKPLDDASQPWVVSLAAEMTDIEGRAIGHFATKIRADGRTIKAGAEKVHGISTKDAAREGVGEQFALGLLAQMAGQLPYGGFVVGFGIDFDRDVIAGAMLRAGLSKSLDRWTRPGLVFRDIKDACTPFCRVPSGRGDDAIKWPTLDIAGEVLLGLPPRCGHHASWDDATRCRKIFFDLIGRGAIEAPFVAGRNT